MNQPTLFGTIQTNSRGEMTVFPEDPHECWQTIMQEAERRGWIRFCGGGSAMLDMQNGKRQFDLDGAEKERLKQIGMAAAKLVTEGATEATDEEIVRCLHNCVRSDMLIPLAGKYRREVQGYMDKLIAEAR